MIGSCIIDTVDIAAYGAFIERGGSDDFLSFPERRTPDFNDWAEYDGLDVDLSDLSFEAKKVSVDFVITGENETLFKHRLNSFKTLHYQPGYRQVYVREFNRTFQLRFVGFSRYRHTGGMVNNRNKRGYLTADYMMDDPLQIFTPAVTAPISQRESLAQIKVNHFDLSEFGVVVREVYSTAIRPRSLKSGLVRNIHSVNGNIADLGAEPKMAARQITINCTMLADSLNEFYVNWNALFNNMRVTVPIELQVTQAGKTIQCYYVKMGNFKKDAPFKRKIKVSFELNFTEL